MKAKILELLKEAKSGAVSGEWLSDQLGISRVSIWKHIKKLQQLGYIIESSGNGYLLKGYPDAVFPWEFPGRKESIHYQETVDSTMTVAKQLARKGCHHFTVVIADRQTSGRGRLSRAWHSRDGGLYFTVILRPEIPPPLMSRYGFAASLVLARVLKNEFGIDARVKWPNDILVNGRKLCGMLSEMEVVGEHVEFLNVGIGINVNNHPAVDEPNAVSIRDILGREIQRKTLLSCFLDQFEQEIALQSQEQIMVEWKKCTETLGKEVKIVTVNHTISGKALDVDETGALLLELPDGRIERVFYGDCFHQSSGNEKP